MLEFIAALREFRRPISAIAIGLVVVQALLAGLAGAQAAASAAGYAVVCHTGSGAPVSPDSGSSSGTGAAHDCCIVCSAAFSDTGASRDPARAAPRYPSDSAQRVHVEAARIAIAARAVRSGLSQAPPILG